MPGPPRAPVNSAIAAAPPWRLSDPLANFPPAPESRPAFGRSRTSFSLSSKRGSRPLRPTQLPRDRFRATFLANKPEGLSPPAPRFRAPERACRPKPAQQCRACIRPRPQQPSDRVGGHPIHCGAGAHTPRRSPLCGGHPLGGLGTQPPPRRTPSKQSSPEGSSPKPAASRPPPNEPSPPPTYRTSGHRFSPYRWPLERRVTPPLGPPTPRPAPATQQPPVAPSHALDLPTQPRPTPLRFVPDSSQPHPLPGSACRRSANRTGRSRPSTRRHPTGQSQPHGARSQRPSRTYIFRRRSQDQAAVMACTGPATSRRVSIIIGTDASQTTPVPPIAEQHRSTAASHVDNRIATESPIHQ